MSIAPPLYVEAPSTQPHEFGLYSASTVVEEDNPRWKLGLEWEPPRQFSARSAIYECIDDYSPGYPLVVDGGVGLVTVVPIVVYGSYACPAGSRPIEDARDRARSHLRLGEERAVETAIATGWTGASPSFADAVDLTPAGGSVSPTDGLAILERAIGVGAAGAGVVHAPRLLGPHLSRDGVVSREGRRLQTMLGTAVAFGAGYDAVVGGPNMVDPGEVWLFASGVPHVRRGGVLVTPEEDFQVQRDVNVVEIIAQRAIAVGWSGVTAAVRVDAPEVPASLDPATDPTSYAAGLGV